MAGPSRSPALSPLLALRGHRIATCAHGERIVDGPKEVLPKSGRQGKESGPVGGLQTRNAIKLSQVVAHQYQVAGDGLGRDQAVGVADWRGALVEVGADARPGEGVFDREGQGLEWGQEIGEPLVGVLRCLALLSSVAQF